LKFEPEDKFYDINIKKLLSDDFKSLEKAIKKADNFINHNDINDINNLKEGIYRISLVDINHSIVFIKKPFGSYFVDPNYGLIRCGKEKPSFPLNGLIKDYKERMNFKEDFSKRIVIENYSLA
jgi:hypothetical protein